MCRSKSLLRSILSHFQRSRNPHRHPFRRPSSQEISSKGDWQNRLLFTGPVQIRVWWAKLLAIETRLLGGLYRALIVSLNRVARPLWTRGWANRSALKTTNLLRHSRITIYTPKAGKQYQFLQAVLRSKSIIFKRQTRNKSPPSKPNQLASSTSRRSFARNNNSRCLTSQTQSWNQR